MPAGMEGGVAKVIWLPSGSRTCASVECLDIVAKRDVEIPQPLALRCDVADYQKQGSVAREIVVGRELQATLSEQVPPDQSLIGR